MTLTKLYTDGTKINVADTKRVLSEMFGVLKQKAK